MREILLIDGYNLLADNQELAQLMADDLTTARDRLINILSDYQGRTGGHFIVVFDGHRLARNAGAQEIHDNLKIVYTKSGETADDYIERLVANGDPQQRFTVVTSDRAEQTTIMSRGGLRRSAREMWLDIKKQRFRDTETQRKKHKKFSNLDERIDENTRSKLEKWRRSMDK